MFYWKREKGMALWAPWKRFSLTVVWIMFPARIHFLDSSQSPSRDGEIYITWRYGVFVSLLGGMRFILMTVMGRETDIFFHHFICCNG